MVDNSKVDLIGFDIDHCLVRYKIDNLLETSLKVQQDILINQYGYKEQDFKIECPIQDLFKFGMNFSVMDVKNGNTLKLDANSKILRAYHGFKRLSEQVLIAQYGQELKIKDFDPLNHRNPDFIVTQTHFVTFLTLNRMISKFHIFNDYLIVIDNRSNKQDQKLTEENYVKIYEDILQSLLDMYRHSKEESYTKIRDYSQFYKIVTDNLDFYLYKDDNIRQQLINLKKKGKILIAVSNSHWEFANYTMSFVYGEDWTTLFDYVFLRAMKPAFFQKDQNFDMFKLDLDSQNFCGPKITEITTQKPEKSQFDNTYIGGRVDLIEKWVEKQLGKKDIQYLFVGDQIAYDNHAPQKNQGWKVVTILEELFPQQKNQNEFSKNSVDYIEIWGDFFEQEHYWNQVVEKYVQEKFQFISCKEALVFWEKI